MQFASAVSKEINAAEAGRELAGQIRRALQNGPIDLACLFLSSHYTEHAEELSSVVFNRLSPRVLLGCTGEGIIAGSEEIENAPAVTLWAAQLPDTSLTPWRLSGSREGGDVGLMEWPDLDTTSEPSTLLVLADPFSIPMEEVLLGMADHCPGSVAIGGMAGGGHDEGENRLLLNEGVYENGLIGIAISGAVCVRTIVSQGCRPIGERYVVTKADRNVIHELGGISALDQLRQMFESLNSHDRNLAQNALHVGIVMDEQRNRFERGDFLVRNLIGADRSSGSLAIGDTLAEGQTIQFHVRDAQSATEDLNLMLAADRSRQTTPALGALLFSCCGRGRGLFGRPHHDVTVIRERAGAIPVAGFFAQGEIGPVGGSNFLHGYTASVALFSERHP
ncbi:MAG TPA: FIST N-terminal domain-containing protein [Nitrospiraceae bacterium]|nr:FIST N-terminal domain-containing protein [Nitrospiraceae bacterium]